MVVAKRQRREKPSKIEQRKVKERSEDGVRTSGRTALLTKPSLHRAGPGGRKKHIKRGAKGLSPACWGALLFASLDQRALTPRRWIFLLSSK